MRGPASLPPLAAALDDATRAAFEQVFSDNAAQVALVREALARLLEGPRDADEDYVDLAVEGLLAHARHLARARGGLARAASMLDGPLRSRSPELMDRAWVPAWIRRTEMRILRTLGEALGFAAWSTLVDEALARPGAGSPLEAPAVGQPERHHERPHVYELAAGAGGLALYLAKSRGHELRLTASDLSADNVELMRAAALREGRSLAIEVRSALELRDVRDVDLFVCTLAAHHFRPGELVRALSQATAVARRGVLVLDLARSASALALTAVSGMVLHPFPPLVYDALQSVRRSYLPAELELLALVAGAKLVVSRPVAPAHVVLHAVGR